MKTTTSFDENEKEQYWIEYIKVRYHEDDISISQIARLTELPSNEDVLPSSIK